jgi:hypothetical protein
MLRELSSLLDSLTLTLISSPLKTGLKNSAREEQRAIKILLQLVVASYPL